MQYRWLQCSTLALVVLTSCTTAQTSANKPEAPATSEPSVQVVKLTQTGCQFLETESQDYQYQTRRIEDCQKINAATLEQRQAGFKPLKLKPGKYIFEVTNRDVSYPLGFYFRGAGASASTLPKVSGGDLTQGKTSRYEVTLTPGDYLFSCPLNPTPDYPVVVQ